MEVGKRGCCSSVGSAFVGYLLDSHVMRTEPEQFPLFGAVNQATTTERRLRRHSV
jgi:hypothetical protein